VLTNPAYDVSANGIAEVYSFNGGNLKEVSHKGSANVTALNWFFPGVNTLASSEDEIFFHVAVPFPTEQLLLVDWTLLGSVTETAKNFQQVPQYFPSWAPGALFVHRHVEPPPETKWATWKTVVIVICGVVFLSAVALLLVFVVRRRRNRHHQYIPVNTEQEDH